MTHAKKQNFNRWCPLLAVPMLMFAWASTAAADAQTSNGTQAPSAVETASESVVPRLIQFSGTVKDAEGKPATGSLELTFSLYQFHEGGSPLWVETQAAQLDSQGRYTVLLGAASPDGLPQDVFTSGTARWLGVQPALPGVDEQPRVLLVGVPYALKAADAETLGGKPASAFMLTGSEPTTPGQGAVSASGGAAAAASPTAASSRRAADKSGPMSTCTSVTADGTATANFVAKFTSGCVIHQSAIFESSGKVGIGNTTPGGALDVSGTTVLRNTLNLSQTTGSTVGVINMGGSPFIHACCSNSNTFVGVNAGNLTTTGAQNTVVGSQALLHNVNGSNNTAIGVDALISNTDGHVNTATGEGALNNNTSGSNNTASGFNALQSNTSGFDNTAIGENALVTNVTGSNNTALGLDADVTSNNLTNATAIGAFATVGESNALVLGCTNCQFGTSPPNVGIGTATPGHKLESAADASAGNNTTWPIALVSKTTPSKMLGMGFDPTLNAGFIEATQTSVGYNALLLNPLGGNVGIGTTSPVDIFTVAQGGGHAISDGWDVYSSRRWKSNIRTLHGALDKVERLRGVEYTYAPSGHHDLGMIAEEVGEVVPEVVSYEPNGKDARGIDYARLTALLVEAVKQQQAEIEQLKGQVDKRR